jgi:hypothetical protein
MSYYPSVCTGLIAHYPIACDPREYGRIRSAGFIPVSYTFDIHDPAAWAAGVTTGHIIVIPETNGEASKASPILGPKYGSRADILLGYEFSAKYEDPNYNSNCAFYNQLVGNMNYTFFYRTSSHVYLSAAPVTIIPNRTVKNDLTDDVVWEVEVRWISREFPCGIALPDSVYEDAYYYAPPGNIVDDGVVSGMPIYPGGPVYNGGLHVFIPADQSVTTGGGTGGHQTG